MVLLNNSKDMSHMRMPYGPDGYFPLKDAVDRILNDVRNVPEEILQLMVMTDEFRCMHSYWKPLKSEVDYNRKNLIYIMDQMHHIIDHSFRANIHVKSERYSCKSLSLFTEIFALKEPSILLCTRSMVL